MLTAIWVVLVHSLIVRVTSESFAHTAVFTTCPLGVGIVAVNYVASILILTPVIFVVPHSITAEPLVLLNLNSTLP
jgi:hypothetical protein